MTGLAAILQQQTRCFQARSSLRSLLVGCWGDSPIPCCPFPSPSPGEAGCPWLRGTPNRLSKTAEVLVPKDFALT